MKKIGYTTGVFDMFHIGHLNILRRAKLECDYLIVGVTTDELSTKNKGKTPIIPLEERMEIVNAIEFVDEVVPQVSYDKFEAWNNIKFDIMFVGDDWKGSDKWNDLEADFKGLGVDIFYFPYTTHTSSSKMRTVIEKIYQDEP
jgi:glycerol-3-phosphate cytidylyltransferase